MRVGWRLPLVFWICLALAGPVPGSAAAQEPAWLESLQQQMEMVQQQMEQMQKQGGFGPGFPGGEEPEQRRAAEAEVSLEVAEAEAGLLAGISAYLEDLATGQRFPLAREGMRFQGAAAPGLYLLKAKVLGPVPFEVQVGRVRVQTGEKVAEKIDLATLLATLKIETAGSPILQGGAIWVYGEPVFRDQPLARLKLPPDGRITGLPAARLYLVLRDLQGAALWQQSVRLFPGEELVQAVVEPKAAGTELPVRLWVRQPPGESAPENLEAVIFDARNQRVTGLTRINEHQFETRLAPGLYTLEVQAGSGRRQRKEIVVGDRPTATDAVLRQDEYGLEFCSDRLVAEAEDLFRAGRRLEERPDSGQALLFYQAADQCLKSEAGKEAVQRLGTRLGQEAEARGFLYQEEFYETVPEARCPTPDHQLFCTPEGERVVFSEDAGAFGWYVVAGRPDLAEAVLLRYARELGNEEVAGFALPLRYFSQKTEQLAALRKIAAEHGRSLLQDEERIFTGAVQSEQRPGRLQSREARSLALLELASQWFALADQPGVAGRRAEERGDDLRRSSPLQPSGLAAALDYFRLAARPRKSEEVQTAADREGERAAGQGEYRRAVRFFEIAGNYVRAAAMEQRLEQQLEQETLQSDSEREAFEQGADALEQELGL